MNPNHSRYSGPDLEQLLDDVRAEHGDDVAIVEANKIRSGGVGGFFSKEVFELVVDTTAAGATATVATAAPGRLLPDDLDIVPASEEEADLLSVGADFDEAPGFADLLRQELGRQWVEETAAVAFDRLDDDAPRRLELRDDDEAQAGKPSERVADLRAEADDLAALRAQVVRPIEIADTHVEAPVDRSRVLGDTASRPDAPGAADSTTRRPRPSPVLGRSGVWARLAAAHEETSLVAAEDDSGTVVIVGDLEPAMLAARRRQRDRLLGSGSLLVLSDRGAVTGLPSWQYVESESALLAGLEGGPDRRLVVIDAPADAPGLGPLLGRLRTRMAVLAMAGAPGADELARAVHAAGVAAAVDLVAPVAAEKVVAYLDAGIPLWSVGGHRLTPELIVALRADVLLGR